MELSLQVKQNGIITANFDEYNAWLDEGLKKYQGLVVTEEQLPECKKMRAELNKVEKAINERKVAIKKEFMKPYTEFENETKALMKKVSDCSRAIDEQIKAYEQKEADAKYQRIKAWWEENGEYAPFERVYDERFLNKSVSDKAWQDSLNTAILNFRADIQVIENMPEEQRAFMRDDYITTLSLSRSMQNWQFYQEQKKRIEAQMAKETEAEPADADEEPVPVPEEPEQHYTIEVFATKKQIEQLGRYIALQMGLRCTVTAKREEWDDGLPF